MNIATMRKLRQFHLYIAVFFAPAMLLFAISGGLQAFRLQQASGWDGAEPPAWMAVIGSVHIDQRLPDAEPEKKPGVEAPKPPAPVDPAKLAERKAKGQKALPMKIFTAALGIALALSTLLGAAIALGMKSTRRVSLVMLAAGAVLPALLLLA